MCCSVLESSYVAVQVVRFYVLPLLLITTISHLAFLVRTDQNF